MTDQEKKIIVEWMGGCLHEWNIDNVRHERDAIECRNCKKRIMYTEKGLYSNPTFDGNYRDAVRDKLKKEYKWGEFISYVGREKSLRDKYFDVAVEYFTDNDLFFTTLANFIDKEGV